MSQHFVRSSNQKRFLGIVWQFEKGEDCLERITQYWLELYFRLELYSRLKMLHVPKETVVANSFLSGMVEEVLRVERRTMHGKIGFYPWVTVDGNKSTR